MASFEGGAKMDPKSVDGDDPDESFTPKRSEVNEEPDCLFPSISFNLSLSLFPFKLSWRSDIWTEPREHLYRYISKTHRQEASEKGRNGSPISRRNEQKKLSESEIQKRKKK